MAAHIYTALLQIHETPDAARLRSGLDYGRMFDDLSMDDWESLSHAADKCMQPGADNPHANRALLRAVVKDILPTYAARWIDLDKPATYEVWHERANARRETIQ